MSEKVKVGKEVAEAIKWYEENAEKSGIIYWEDELLYNHALNNNGEIDVREEIKPLLKYSAFELAEILVKGYEIYQTPEEQLSTQYNEIFKRNPRLSENYEKGIMDGIELALDTLGIEIDGINKNI